MALYGKYVRRWFFFIEFIIFIRHSANTPKDALNKKYNTIPGLSGSQPVIKFTAKLNLYWEKINGQRSQRRKEDGSIDFHDGGESLKSGLCGHFFLFETLNH